MSEPSNGAWPFQEIPEEEGLDISAIFGNSSAAPQGDPVCASGGSTERSVVSDTRGAGNHTGSCCNIAADNRTHRQGTGRSSCGESHCRSV